MEKGSINAAIAAAIILVVFALGAYFLPSIMLALGEFSAFAAGLFAILFVAAFFGIFYLRGKSCDPEE